MGLIVLISLFVSAYFLGKPKVYKPQRKSRKFGEGLLYDCTGLNVPMDDHPYE